MKKIQKMTLYSNKHNMLNRSEIKSSKFITRNKIVVVVINFISGLLNNTNNKENNSKPEKEHSDKTIYVETCTNKKTIGK